MSFIKTKQLNKQSNIADYKNAKSLIYSRPRMVFLELTQNCNLQCSMCRSQNGYDPSLTMALDRFKKICDILLPYAEYVDLRGWGESTIIPNFLEYLEYASKFDCKLKLITNLTLSNDNIWYSLVEKNTIISISFDSPIKKTYEEIRRGSSYETVRKNIKKVVEYSYQIHGSTERLMLTTVVQGCNLHEIPQLVDMAKKEGIERIKLFPIITSLNNPNNLFHHLVELKNRLVETYIIAKEKSIIVEVCATLHPYLSMKERFPECCIHPWMYTYVSYDGRIGFCDHLMANSKYTEPFKVNGDFTEIWNSELFLNIRNDHIEYRKSKKAIKNFEPCNWCYQNRYIDLEDWLYPKLSESKLYLEDLIKALELNENIHRSPVIEFNNF